MKLGDSVRIVGLLKAKHLNNKVGVIIKEDEGDRFHVEVDADDTTMVIVILFAVSALFAD